MKFLFVLAIIVLVIVIATMVCTKGSSHASKQEDYLEECARHRLSQRQDEDNNLD